MPKPTNQDVQRLLEAAAKLIIDYRSEFRTTRYTVDDQNVNRLIDAMQPFSPPDELPKPCDRSRGWEVRS